MKKIELIGVADCIAPLYLWAIKGAKNMFFRQRKGILN